MTDTLHPVSLAQFIRGINSVDIQDATSAYLEYTRVVTADGSTTADHNMAYNIGRASLKQPTPEQTMTDEYKPSTSKTFKCGYRLLSEAGSPYGGINFTKSDIELKDMQGNVVYAQKDVEFPDFYSENTKHIVANKYFYGAKDSPNRECSMHQLVARVVNKLADWAELQGYFPSGGDRTIFYNNMTYLLLNQYGAFNSPVWFNLGTPEKQQASACFINGLEDSMESICELQTTEMMIFKGGSGAGTNVSRLRAKGEPLNGGGTSSGPLSFMRGFDQNAGSIKSGGKTRRAAKMVIMDVDHPDIREFISCKALEEKKAQALIAAGYDGSFAAEDGAYATVAFQNANHSVCVTDEFMQAACDGGSFKLKWRTDPAKGDTINAAELLDQMARTCWESGDPGIHFGDAIQLWHTCPEDGRIYASNPCVTGDTLVATSEGLVTIESLVDRHSSVRGLDGGFHAISPAFVTGEKPVYMLTTKSGYTLKATGDHRIFTINRGDVPLSELTKDDVLLLQGAGFGESAIKDQAFAEMIGFAVGDGCVGQDGTLSISMSSEEKALAIKWAGVINAIKRTFDDGRSSREVVPIDVATGIQVRTSSKDIVDACNEWAVLDEKSQGKLFTPKALSASKETTAALLRGLFTADGTVANYGDKSQYVALDSTALPLLQQVQLMLLSFGVKSKIHKNRRAIGQTTAVLPDGQGGTKEYPVLQIHSLRISKSSRITFEREIGFIEGNLKNDALARLNATASAYADHMSDAVKSIEPLGVQTVYDLTESDTHHFVGNGLTIHNCSEYLHLNDTSCNLASLNLYKFIVYVGGRPAYFDFEAFIAAASWFAYALDVIIDLAHYPTEKIKEETLKSRTIGLGYANLGATLMALGLAYDSPEGRRLAAAITHAMNTAAYVTSHLGCKVLGLAPFERLDRNRAAMAEVLARHVTAYGDVINEIWLDNPGVEAKGGFTADSLAVLQDSYRKLQSVASSVRGGGGIRNAQATVLAPTGTIAFMMGCDTTGVEPAAALVTKKYLVGGGTLKLTLNCLRPAFLSLGYTEGEAAQHEALITDRESIADVPFKHPSHRAVFATAFGGDLDNNISYEGHIKMMAAVQPALSGAISKTINLPSSATPDDVRDAILMSWKSGLKAIAIYRDASKQSQPLTAQESTRAEDNTDDAPLDDVDAGVAVAYATEESTEAKPSRGTADLSDLSRIALIHGKRRKLPETRTSKTHKFSINGQTGYVTIGEDDDGAPLEIFVAFSKMGSTMRGFVDSFAVNFSIALQYGTPLEVLVRAHKNTQFEPSGFTNNKRIRTASSITDYIVRWLEMEYLQPKVLEDAKEHSTGLAGLQREAAVRDALDATLERRKRAEIALAPTSALSGGVYAAGLAEASHTRYASTEAFERHQGEGVKTGPTLEQLKDAILNDLNTPPRLAAKVTLGKAGLHGVVVTIPGDYNAPGSKILIDRDTLWERFGYTCTPGQTAGKSTDFLNTPRYKDVRDEKSAGVSGNTCGNCGGQLVSTGPCLSCPSCGETYGGCG